MKKNQNINMGLISLYLEGEGVRRVRYITRHLQLQRNNGWKERWNPKRRCLWAWPSTISTSSMASLSSLKSISLCFLILVLNYLLAWENGMNWFLLNALQCHFWFIVSFFFPMFWTVATVPPWSVQVAL